MVQFSGSYVRSALNIAVMCDFMMLFFKCILSVYIFFIIKEIHMHELIMNKDN